MGGERIPGYNFGIVWKEGILILVCIQPKGGRELKLVYGSSFNGLL